MNNLQEFLCQKCSKRYSDQAKYLVHLKVKHKIFKSFSKFSLNQQEMAELEDSIYSFFGQLAQKYSDHSRANFVEMMIEENKHVGQANFLPSNIVRTPYEKQLDVVDELRKHNGVELKLKIEISKEKAEEICNLINQQINVLNQKLQQQRPLWEFADPFDETIDFEDQFSVLDIPKLIRNYEKRRISLKYPEISIFILWIGRICKPEMIRLVYQILKAYAIAYESESKKWRSQEVRNVRKNLKNWKKFLSRFKRLPQNTDGVRQENEVAKTILDCFQLRNQTDLNQNEIYRFTELYQEWAKLVISSSEFCILDENENLQQIL